MNTFPDKRAIGIFVAIGVVAASHFLAVPGSAWDGYSQIALYVAMILGGLAFAVIDIREGYCINRPYVTQEESPFMFWSEVVVAILVAIAGIYKLSRLS
jgi:hypothetical protein